jgi:hypothetical protein
VARLRRWQQRGVRELMDMAWVRVAGPLEKEIAKRS